MGRTGVISSSGFAVNLFGPFRMVSDGKIMMGPTKGCTRDLLIYLLHSIGQVIRRDRVAEIFWNGSTQRNRASLSTALWRLNKAVSKVTPLRIEATDDFVWMECDTALRLDRDILQRCVAEAQRVRRHSHVLSDDLRQSLEDAVTACQGDYLEGCDMAWAANERDAATELQLNAYRYLADDARAAECGHAAIRWVQAGLDLDPYHENLHHMLMELYVATGRRGRAILHYESLSALLKDELGIAPQEATTTLRNRLIASPG